MIGKPQAGAPLSLSIPPFELEVTQVGSFSDANGILMVLRNGHLVIDGALDGSEFTLGISIERLLEAIQAYNHAVGS